MDDTLDLRDYLAVLRRRRWLVVLVTVVVTATAVGVSLLQTPVYEASTDVLVEPVRRSEDATLENILLGESAVETERRVMTSRPVTERVIAELGLDIEPDELVEEVTTTAAGDARVIELSVTSTDAEWATAVANSYAASYLEHRRSRAIDELVAAQDELQRRAQDLRDQVRELDEEIADAQNPPPTAEGEPAPPPVDTSALEGERQRLLAQLAQVEASTVDAAQPSDLVRGGGEVLVPAEVPRTPVSPKPLRTGVLGLVLGLMLGVGLAFLRDHLDDGIRDEDDVRRIAGSTGAPVLGKIAHWTDRRADERLMTLIDPHDLVSEEFRALSANVRFSLINRHRQGVAAESQFRQQSILVTSSNPGEGKSSVAGNLAVAASLAGLRVILVDADMRQPTLKDRFGVPAGRGMSDLLVDTDVVLDDDGEIDHEQIVAHLADIGLARLRVLPAGTVPPNPTELLASPQMRMLHERLRSVADLVVYDSPPLLPVADTLELSTYVDAVLVVARANVCRRRDLGEAIDRLDAVGAPLGGFVLNDIPPSKAAGYGYGYRHSYRPREAEVAEPASRKERRQAARAASRADASPAAVPPVEAPRPASRPAAPTGPAERPAAPVDQVPASGGTDDETHAVLDHEVDPIRPAPAPAWIRRGDDDGAPSDGGSSSGASSDPVAPREQRWS